MGNGGVGMPDGSALMVGTGATVNLGASETVGSLAGAGNVTLGANTLTAGGDNSNTTFSGIGSGTGGLTKAGSGKDRMCTRMNSSHQINSNAGFFLKKNGTAIADASAVTVGTGATFNLGATETVGSLAGAGNVTLGANTLTAGGDNSNTRSEERRVGKEGRSRGAPDH